MKIIPVEPSVWPDPRTRDGYRVSNVRITTSRDVEVFHRVMAKVTETGAVVIHGGCGVRIYSPTGFESADVIEVDE